MVFVTLRSIYFYGRIIHQQHLKFQTSELPFKKLPMLVLASLKIGGGGKTSSTITLSTELTNLGIHHAILCLDLEKNMLKQEILRKINSKTPYSFSSDEACLIAQSVNSEFATVFLCKRRDLAWKELARQNNHKIILSDDGWEDPRISKAFVIRILTPNEKENPSKSDLFPEGNYRSLLEQHPTPLKTLRISDSTNPAVTPDFSILTSLPINSDGQTISDWKNTVLIIAIGDSSRVIAQIKKQGLLPYEVINLKDHSNKFQDHVKKEINKERLVLSTTKDLARLDKNLKKHPSIYGLQYSLKLNYPIHKLIERANVKF
jgi:tetraacyldisaccharide-1-P 4'-kinase